jgi:hypothetical protein
MSAAHIVFCRGFDIATLSDEPRFDEMQALHTALAETYPAEDEEAA